MPSVDVFRCPSDKSIFPFGDFRKGETKRRIRSYSQNGFMGYPGNYVNPNIPPYKSAIKMTDLTRPGPSEVYVFVDEHMNAINDSHFLPYKDLKAFDGRWLDTISGRHGNATGFAFADGHAEIHKWVDSDCHAGASGGAASLHRRPQRPRGAAGPPRLYVVHQSHRLPAMKQFCYRFIQLD